MAGGSPAASHFLLLRQKKVTKEKATPGSSALRASLRDEGLTGRFEKLGLEHDLTKGLVCARPQTFEAECPGHPSIARRLAWGPEVKGKFEKQSEERKSERRWIPAFAGMTAAREEFHSELAQPQFGSSLRDRRLSGSP